MSGIKSPEPAFYNVAFGNYGQQDIGVAQLGGNVSSAAEHKDGVLFVITNATARPPRVGESLYIAGTTNYNGAQRIVRRYSDTEVVCDTTWVDDQSGTWTRLGATGRFLGFIPMTTLNAADITTLTLEQEDSHGGDPLVVIYQAGLFYPFPGIITDILLSAGNVRLFRAGSGTNPDA